MAPHSKYIALCSLLTTSYPIEELGLFELSYPSFRERSTFLDVEPMLTLSLLVVRV